MIDFNIISEILFNTNNIAHFIIKWPTLYKKFNNKVAKLRPLYDRFKICTG